MNKVIFLDFDGVLNDFYPINEKDEAEIEKNNLKFKKKKERRKYIYDNTNYLDTDDIDSPRLWKIVDLDNDKVEYLNKIIEKTNAKIVFSTSWRSDYHLPLYLTIMGFKYPLSCIGRTGYHKNRRRGIEIQDWLDGHKEFDKYAIIDDEGFDIEEYHGNNNFFKVKGLNENDADKIIEWLNKEKNKEE